MEIAGSTEEYPLPELLQMLDQRRATGCLILNTFSDHYAGLKPQTYVVWLNQGNIVSAHHGSYEQDIFSLAAHKQWISRFAAKKLAQRLPANTSAGLYLEAQGVLNFGQLRTLFFSEVINRVEALCHIKLAHFKFQSTTELPMQEMTGLSISATKVAMQGLRGDCSLIQLRKDLFDAVHLQFHPSHSAVSSNVQHSVN